MRFNFEGFEFELPAFTLLSGPMAAAKPLFAQKFIVEFLKEHPDWRVLYFATSSPICGILRNLRIFGLGDEDKGKITFLDYQPSCEELREVEGNYYIGNFSNKDQLETALKMAGEKTMIVIPSFTLLLVGAEDKEELGRTLVRTLSELKVNGAVSFVAVNSKMFEGINVMLEDEADNVMEFIKRGDDVYILSKKFRGKAPEGEVPFKFPREAFQSTKKEVAERTARIIREKKVM
jgi:KaiC/GvpD/RAD55 family RecA-like ATPase